MVLFAVSNAEVVVKFSDADNLVHVQNGLHANRFYGPRYLTSACIVCRNGSITLLFSTEGNGGIIELTSMGVHMRKIEQHYLSSVCYANDVIAAFFTYTSDFLLLNYGDGAVLRRVQSRLADWLCIPQPGGTVINYGKYDMCFTADGQHVLISNMNLTVSKFCVVSGQFVGHVATRSANGLASYAKLLPCDDGGLVLASVHSASTGGILSLVEVDSEGVTRKVVSIPPTRRPLGLAWQHGDVRCYKNSLLGLSWLDGDVCCYYEDDTVFICRRGMSLPRRAWVSACILSS